MTAVVAASKSYELLGSALGPTREDLEDMIYDITPMETKFLTMAGRGKARSTIHEWPTDSLAAASATNFAIEGDAFSAQAVTPPSRLKNYTAITKKEIEVTGTAQAIDNAGISTLMAYQTARKAREIKRDMESAMLANNPASAGTSTSPRVSAGVPNWLYSSAHVKSAGQSGGATTAPVSGFATATITNGTATAFTETHLKSVLQQAWEKGGETETIWVGPSLYSTISNFTGIATRFRNVESNQQAQIIGAADVYVSQFGSHNIILSRYIGATDVFALDMDLWSVNYLRPFQTINIAQVGDSVRATLLAEWTLVSKSPLGNAKANNVA